jgi:hypothetical protein
MKITVNGQEYASWDDVPEETRRLLGRVLPDEDGNGVPDAFEGKAEPGRHTYRKVILTKPGQAPAPAPATDGTTVPEGKIMLNGELVDADAEQPKTHWWQRG